MTVDLQKLKDKFFTDPDWPMMEELIESYIAPFRGIDTLKTDMTNDEIASEVRGRQLMVERLDKFLADAQVIRTKYNKVNNSYK